MKSIFIDEIRVENLFNLYTYTINKKYNKFSILYGDNGCGKTSILSLIFHLLNPEEKNGHRTAIGDIPFTKFSIRLSNGEKIIATRQLINERKYTIQFTYKSKEISYTWTPDSNKRGPSERNYILYCKYLEDLSFNTLYLTANRQIYEGEYKSENRILQNIYYEDDIVRKKVSNEITLENVLESFYLWIHKKTIQLNNLGNQTIDNHYCEMIKNISNKKNEDYDYLAIKTQIDELKTKNLQFTKFGLSTEFLSDDFQKNIKKIKDEDWKYLGPVLEPYISSLGLRLDALRSLQDRLQKLENYLTKFFKDKQISIDPFKGVKIFSKNGMDLAPYQLSSGEKQVLYLFCRVMTYSDNSSLVIIDEPEISLNIKWQREFLDALYEIIGIDTKVQIIIASHSIEMISPYEDGINELISE